MQLNSKLYTYIRSFFLVYIYRKAKPMTLTSLTLHNLMSAMIVHENSLLKNWNLMSTEQIKIAMCI